jgi:hypothetical protein
MNLVGSEIVSRSKVVHLNPYIMYMFIMTLVMFMAYLLSEHRDSILTKSKFIHKSLE